MLKHPIRFNNMVDPQKTLDVSFLFMILNNDPTGQANVLAQIMDFLAHTSVDKLMELFSLDSTKEIYDFLTENFKQA